MSAKAKVVVTGATGHLGNVLVRELVARARISYFGSRCFFQENPRIEGCRLTTTKSGAGETA